MEDANHLPHVTTVASLAISKSSAGVNQMPKMLGSEVRDVATKAMAIKAMGVAMVIVMGRLMV